MSLWIEQNCKFPSTSELKGKVCGEYLLPFQKEILKAYDSGQSLFLYGARKISKSLIFSWILFERLNNSQQAFVAPLLASCYEQTGIIFRFVRESIVMAGMEKDYKIRQHFIEKKDTGSVIFRAFSSPASLFGYQPSAVCADELANWKDRELLEAVESGFGLSEKHPLCLYASNPADDPVHFVGPLLIECEKDRNFSVYKFCAGPKDDWMSEDVWRKVNPFLAENKRNPKRFKVLAEYYKKRCEAAKKNKEREIGFRRYQLGQSVYSEFNKWFSPELIKVCDESVFNNKSIRWSLGIDLSMSRDFSAIVLCGMGPDDNIYFKPWLCLANLESRRVTHRYKFKKWDKAGFMKIQGEKVTNVQTLFNEVQDFINQRKLHIEKVIVDQFRAESIYELLEKNYPNKIDRVLTGPRQMTLPIIHLERAAFDKKLHIIGSQNECFLWQVGNCLVSKQSKSWVSLRRTDSHELNIDGPIALCLASGHLFSTKKAKINSFFVAG